MCNCGCETNGICVEDDSCIGYNNGFLYRTVYVCLKCQWLYVWYFSMGDFKVENFDDKFENYSDKEELDDYIEEAKRIEKENNENENQNS